MEIPIDHEPTAGDMHRLQPRRYYVWDGVAYINTIRDRHVCRFVCPWCFTRYRKDGKPCANAKPTVHIHGSYVGSDGFGRKGSHCRDMPPHLKGDYIIYCKDESA